jgi:hypothetical protein
MTQIYQTQRSIPHLNYYGGKVLKSPRFVSLYYGSYWSSASGQAYRQYFDRFARSIVKSPYASLWKEYGAGKGIFDGGQLVRAAKTPHAITESDVQSIIRQGLANGTIRKGGPETVYTLFLPPDVILKTSGSSSEDGLGGYHGSYNDKNGKKIYYAALAFSRDGNGIDFTGNPRDNITITASHEWTEAVTDPDVNNGKLGWYDERYGEAGDIPINLGTPLASLYGRIKGYAVQKEWSNLSNSSKIQP